MRPLVLVTALAALSVVVALRSRSSEPPAARADPGTARGARGRTAHARRVERIEPRRGIPRPSEHAAGGSYRARRTRGGERGTGVTRARAVPARTVAPKRPPRTSGSPAEFLADALFRRLDADGDGVLTGSEIPSELRAAVGPRGSLDAESFAKLFQTAVQRLRTAAAEAAATSDRFESLDVEGTGRVPLSRWRPRGRRRRVPPHGRRRRRRSDAPRGTSVREPTGRFGRVPSAPQPATAAHRPHTDQRALASDIGRSTRAGRGSTADEGR